MSDRVLEHALWKLRIRPALQVRLDEPEARAVAEYIRDLERQARPTVGRPTDKALRGPRDRRYGRGTDRLAD
jgi:hypothetical protein